MINRADHISPGNRRDEAFLPSIQLWLLLLLLSLMLVMVQVVLVNLFGSSNSSK